jgi:glycerophosphoryl diester phosphodiesterase
VRVFDRERPPLLARLARDKKRSAFLLGVVIKLTLVLSVVYRKHELQLTKWIASPPPSFCAALAASDGKPPPPQPLVCAHSRDHDHPSPDSPDALREALAAGTGCVLLHVASTADGELAVIRNTPSALGLLTRPAKGSALAQRAAALGSARRWWRQATVGDLTLEELRTLRWRRPRRKRRALSGGGNDDDDDDDDSSSVLTLEQALRLLLAPPSPSLAAKATNTTTLIIDLERPTGAARASVPLADFAARAVATATRAGCGGGGGGGDAKEAGAAQCLFWAMQDDLVVEAGEAVGRLRKTSKKRGKRRGGDEASGGGGQEGEPAAYEPVSSSSSSSSSSSALSELGYFVAQRRDPRHPRLEGVASAAAVHVEMLSAGGGGSGVAASLHAQKQRVFAYLVNRAAPLRQAVVAGADAVVTDRASQVAGVLGAWRRNCEANAAAVAGGRRRR